MRRCVATIRAYVNPWPPDHFWELNCDQLRDHAGVHRSTHPNGATVMWKDGARLVLIPRSEVSG